MLRDIRAVKKKVQGFVESSRVGMKCHFGGDHLTLEVTITCGTECGKVSIRNKFADKSGSWIELKKHLQTYLTNVFPNEEPWTIVPSKGNELCS